MVAPPSGRGRLVWTAGLLAAHALPAALVWAVLGGLLSAIAPAREALLAALGYALLYGSAETLRTPLRPPGLRWEVPAAWVWGRSPAALLLIWGGLLGPGLVTLNPYAGMWLVPLLLASSTDATRAVLVGTLAGLAHGSGRAMGVLRNMHGCEHPTGFGMLLAQMRWRLADGIALLVATGVLFALQT